MAYFRKKPVTVEAVRWEHGTAEEAEEILKWIRSEGHEAILKDNDDWFISILTLEGPMQCRPTDYVIKGVKGEFYPCKRDIFEQTYESVDNA